MNGGGSSASQRPSWRSERRPRAVSHDACHAAVTSAHNATAWSSVRSSVTGAPPISNLASASAYTPPDSREGDGMQGTDPSGALAPIAGISLEEYADLCA